MFNEEHRAINWVKLHHNTFIRVEWNALKVALYSRNNLWLEGDKSKFNRRRETYFISELSSLKVWCFKRDQFICQGLEQMTYSLMIKDNEFSYWGYFISFCILKGKGRGFFWFWHEYLISWSKETWETWNLSFSFLRRRNFKKILKTYSFLILGRIG